MLRLEAHARTRSPSKATEIKESGFFQVRLFWLVQVFVSVETLVAQNRESSPEQHGLVARSRHK